jgi:hypothetical protein
MKGGMQEVEPTAEVCSLFNLGISLFHNVVDREPQILPKLLRLVDYGAMCELTKSDKGGSYLVHMTATEKVNEIRIFCKIIGALFGRLHELKSTSPPIFEQAAESILTWYRAEIASLEADSLPNLDQTQLSKARSYLPSVIIFRVTQLSPNIDLESSEDFSRVSVEIGEIFWLVDNLLHVLDDYNAARANFISAQFGEQRYGNTSDPRPFLLGLLKGHQVEETSISIASKVHSIMKDFEHPYPVRERWRTIGDFLSMHIRDWVR